MIWKIKFYDEKLMKAIHSWPVHLSAKFTKIVELIEKMGPYEVGMPHIKPLKQGLFEIRVKGLEGIARVIFCTIKGKNIILLNEFIKKTQKTPQSELIIAKQRMKEVQKNE